MNYEILNREKLIDKLKECEAKEKKFQSFFENSNVGKSITHLDGKMELNDAFASMLGYSKEEFLNLNWQEITHSDDNEFSKKTVSDLINGKGDEAEFVKRYIHKDGRIIFANVNTKLLRDENKKPLFFITSILDISENIRILEENKNLADKWSTTFNAIKDLIFLLKKDGTILDANNSAKSFAERGNEHLIGNKIKSCEFHRDVCSEKCSFESTVNSKKRENSICRFGENWFETSTDPVKKNDEIIMYIHIMRDITQRKKDEKKIFDSEKKFGKLIELSPIPAVVSDLDWKIIFVNKRFRTAIDYKIDEFDSIDKWWESHNPKEVFSENRYTWKEIKSNILGNVDKGKKQEILIELSERKPIFILLFFSRIKDSYLFYFYDLTQRIHYEQQLLKTIDEKKTLLKEIHHRVKNNLQIIISLLALQEKSIDDEFYSALLNDSQNRIRSLALVHEDLHKSDQVVNVNIKEYLTKLILNIFQSIGESGKKIKIENKIKDVSIDIDNSIFIGLIVNEIISNSIKYAFPEGESGTISINLSIKKKRVHLNICDNGQGFPDDFDFNASNSLGIKLIKLLVYDQLDGQLSINSTNGAEYEISFNLN